MGNVNIRYFEIIFDNGAMNTDECAYSICIKADHKPTKEEVKEFCKKDMELYDAIDISDIIDLEEIEAYDFYDGLDNAPILTNTEKKIYKVPVSYEMYGYVYIEADDLEEACSIAEEDETIPLPYNAEYVEGSWLVDWDVAQIYND